MKNPKTTGTGGPLISLETTDRPDMLAVVWMAISTSEAPIAGYRVYLNGQMCGNQVGYSIYEGVHFLGTLITYLREE